MLHVRWLWRFQWAFSVQSLPIQIPTQVINFSFITCYQSISSVKFLFLHVCVCVFNPFNWLRFNSFIFRYCSNLYPKAESYQVCNWCLSQRDEKEKSQNSSNSSSSNKINGREEDDSKNVKNKKKNHDGSNNNNNNRVLLMKSQRSINLKLQQPNNKPIEKQRSPERLPPPPTPTPRTRKRIITNGALEEKNLIKRKKSEEMANNNNNNNNSNSNNTVTPVRRPFFRNKVRRYKLLDEVSS